MKPNITTPAEMKGLTLDDVSRSQKQFGKNLFQQETPGTLIHFIWRIIKEPMFILLLVACSIYFLLGDMSEGFLMLTAMVLVGAISLYNDVRSTNALKLLSDFTAPHVTVIRDDRQEMIPSAELVPGDVMILEEGMSIPADARVLQGHDLSVNESMITGESIPVDKTEHDDRNMLFQGTTINTGKCIARVIATGNNTVLGKLGKAVARYEAPQTVLQTQLGRFLRYFVLFGVAGFVTIFLTNLLRHHGWATSLLFALTLAMSAIPEEIPVAFSSFMALGAYKMSRLGIISRQPQVIENLGAVSVFCFDKTGTLTENNMKVNTVYSFDTDVVINMPDNETPDAETVLFYAALASETDPFDPMEKAILEAYGSYGGTQRHRTLPMIHEYPLEGRPPMMTHVYDEEGTHIVAAKGAVERIMEVCHISDTGRNKINHHVYQLSSKGYRVIGVCSAFHKGEEFPNKQDEFDWKFEGLIALHDPMKKNIPSVLSTLTSAGINIKLLTGDYRATAINIATQAGIAHPQQCVDGRQVMDANETELAQIVNDTNVFCRMFPDAKVKVIQALKAGGNLVAMTGDGVNDGPALKSADIGIALGFKGTAIARRAADLVLTDDNMSRLVDAIKEGRKIYSNLKKAIRYIVSIHIPIVLTASLPLLFGWIYPNIFSPIHVIFLELIMGPTCSIFFEREPVEENLMAEFPRRKSAPVFTRKELILSITQGLVIAAGILIVYYLCIDHGLSIDHTRSMVFTTLIFSNIFLTFANRSFKQTVLSTSRYRNNLAPFILAFSILFLILLHVVQPVRELFELAPISFAQAGLCLAIAFVSVAWFEVYKGLRYSRGQHRI